ncbi:MAG: hypothetical protein JXB45_07570 [Candidatus Krumholzibacteriota bacterium]|nr:hypothetical protein [Candidatus Krumholzibacteriota bacterium]
MKKIPRLLVLPLLLCMLAIGSNCVMEEKIIEIVVTDETCQEYDVNSTTQDIDSSSEVLYGEVLDEALGDAGLARSEIRSASVVSASFEVLEFKHDHDWIISGAITVGRKGAGGPVPLIEYTNQSVKGALNKKVEAELETNGVNVLNQALSDFIAGANPVIVIAVDNGSVGPAPGPTAGDPIVFKWRACIVMQVVLEEEVSRPDLF